MKNLILFFFVVGCAAPAHAANFNPSVEDPIVGYRGHEVVPGSLWKLDGVSIRAPRDDWPNPHGGAPNVDRFFNMKFDHTQYDTSIRNLAVWLDTWTHYSPYYNNPDKHFGPCNHPGKGRPPFCDQQPPVVEPEVPSVPLPLGLHLLVTALFIFGVVKWFPQSLIDRPDRSEAA